MKKVTVVLSAMFLLGAVQAVAASDTNQKITNARTVKASKDTTLTYGKLKFVVPAGQTIQLGQADNGSVVISADTLDGVKAGKSTLSAKAPVVLSVNPKTNVVVVEQGDSVQVSDAEGRTAELSQGAAVDGNDIRQTVSRSWPVSFPLSWRVENDVPQSSANTNNQNNTAASTPDFVAQEEVSSAANEQVVQDVEETELREEETLSPSAPRER